MSRDIAKAKQEREEQRAKQLAEEVRSNYLDFCACQPIVSGAVPRVCCAFQRRKERAKDFQERESVKAQIARDREERSSQFKQEKAEKDARSEAKKAEKATAKAEETK